MSMKRINFYLSEKHIKALEEYARQNSLMATTGRKVGKPDKSAAMRAAIEVLIKSESLATPAPTPTEG